MDELLISVGAWLEREIPEPDYLMGGWLHSSSRALIAAETGIGKSHLALGLGAAVATGTNFLNWTAHRPRKVLILDGEMSSRLVKRRLHDLVRRLGQTPDNLYVVCSDDWDYLRPLNTPEGQERVDGLIDRLGGVDLLILDNIASLTGGDMKSEEGWQPVQPWSMDLTRRSIGQIWIHHAGHNTAHAYGSSTRQWQMDTVLLLDRVPRPAADIAFKLNFVKHRERCAENRADFEPRIITLASDRWQVEQHSPPSANAAPALPEKQARAYQALRDRMASNGQMPVPVADFNRLTGEPANRAGEIRAALDRKGLITVRAGLVSLRNDG